MSQYNLMIMAFRCLKSDLNSTVLEGRFHPGVEVLKNQLLNAFASQLAVNLNEVFMF